LIVHVQTNCLSDDRSRDIIQQIVLCSLDLTDGRVQLSVCPSTNAPLEKCPKKTFGSSDVFAKRLVKAFVGIQMERDNINSVQQTSLNLDHFLVLFSLYSIDGLLMCACL
jgi:hypothetical protein